MPHPGAGFPIPPFEWPHVGRQWPAYNVESDQAEGLVVWMPWGGGYPGSRHHADMIGGLTFTENGTPEWKFHPERGWMLHFTRGDSDYLMGTPSPTTTTPITLSTWFVADSSWAAWTNYNALCITDPAVGDLGEHHRIYINALAANTTWAVRAETRDSGGTGQAGSTITGSLGVPYLLTGVFRSATDREIYLNGISLATNATSRTPTGIDRIIVASALQWEGASNAFLGSLGDARAYNRAFTAAEVWQIYANPWELYQLPRRLWRLGVPTGITIGMDTLSLTGAAQTMTQVSGAVSLTMDTLNLAGTAQALTQISGAVSLAMDTLGLTGSAQASTVSVGAVSLVMDVLDLVGAAQNLAVAPGAVTLAMDALSLSATAQTLTVSTAIIIVMDALGLIGAAQSLAVTPGAVSLLMDVLGLTGDVQSLAVAPGAVSLAMDTLDLAGNAQGLSVVPGAVALAMDALNLSGAAETLTQVSGAVALVMDALNLTGSAQSLTVSTGIFIAMTLLGLTGNAQALAVVPGEVTIAMSELQAAVAALALAVLAVGGKLDVALTDAAATLLASSDAVATALAMSDAAVTALAMDDETRG